MSDKLEIKEKNERKGRGERERDIYKRERGRWELAAEHDTNKTVWIVSSVAITSSHMSISMCIHICAV